MLFAMQHWQKPDIISRNSTILINFNPFMAIMRNIYHIHESSAGDLVHIIEEKTKNDVNKKPPPEFRTVLLIQLFYSNNHSYRVTNGSAS